MTKCSGLNVAFRVDASIQIGTGHLMRCLTLADAMQQQGAYTRFICRHIPPSLAGLIQAKGHDIRQLESKYQVKPVYDLKHSSWLGVSQECDVEETLKKNDDIPWQWIVTDHYALDHRWEEQLQATGVKLLAIDDLADRHHTCDIFLNQNLVEHPEALYASKTPLHTIKLIGPKYSLLRDEFIHARQQATLRDRVDNIMVFFGGIDSNNSTAKALEAISQIERSSLNVDVVIGLQHPKLENIKAHCQRMNYNCHIQTTEMAKLMAKADLSIGAGGSASWERCCLGLPSIILTIADNQIPIAHAVDKAGVSIYLGHEMAVQSNDIAQAINRLMMQPTTLKKISKRCLALMDGLGKNRVIESMLSIT